MTNTFFICIFLINSGAQCKCHYTKLLAFLKKVELHLIKDKSTPVLLRLLTSLATTIDKRLQKIENRI